MEIAPENQEIFNCDDDYQEFVPLFEIQKRDSRGDFVPSKSRSGDEVSTVTRSVGSGSVISRLRDKKINTPLLATRIVYPTLPRCGTDFIVTTLLD